MHAGVFCFFFEYWVEGRNVTVLSFKLRFNSLTPFPDMFNFWILFFLEGSKKGLFTLVP